MTCNNNKKNHCKEKEKTQMFKPKKRKFKFDSESHFYLLNMTEFQEWCNRKDNSRALHTLFTFCIHQEQAYTTEHSPDKFMNKQAWKNKSLEIISEETVWQDPASKLSHRFFFLNTSVLPHSRGVETLPIFSWSLITSGTFYFWMEIQHVTMKIISLTLDIGRNSKREQQ